MYFFSFIGGNSANKGSSKRVPAVLEALGTLFHSPILAGIPPVKGAKEACEAVELGGVARLLNWAALRGCGTWAALRGCGWAEAR